VICAIHQFYLHFSHDACSFVCCNPWEGEGRTMVYGMFFFLVCFWVVFSFVVFGLCTKKPIKPKKPKKFLLKKPRFFPALADSWFCGNFCRAELPEAVKKREQRLRNDDLQLCVKHISRDMTKLNGLGRRWADYKRSSSLFLGRYFHLQRIVRDAIADYELVVVWRRVTVNTEQTAIITVYPNGCDKYGRQA